MANARSLLAIEEEVRATVGGGSAAPIALTRLLEAIEQGGPTPGDARAGIDALARRLRLDYHINGQRGVVVFRASAAT